MRVKAWIKNNKAEVSFILLILSISLFLRIYKIDQYMTFLGDEGRDALVIKQILTVGDIPFIGPPTSVGNMYLGPLYYYLMVIPMTISWLNPIAAAVMVAIIGTLTVGLVYYLARDWFGTQAALIAAILYALSPINIIYSRSSWNPNPTPFFALITLLGFHLARKKANYKWLILSGVGLAFAIQMHYLALILIPIVGILWIYELFKGKGKSFFEGSLLGVVSFLLLMSPLVLFDLKHNFVNYRALTNLISSKDSAIGFSVIGFFAKLQTVYFYNLINRYLAGPSQILVILTSLLVAFPIIWGGIKQKIKGDFYWPIFVLATWLIIGLLGLSLYKQEVYDHYVGFLNPVPFLLLAASFYFLNSLKHNYKKFIIFGMIILIGVLILTSLGRIPLKDQPNNQLERTQEIANFIINQSANKPFNFALIAEHNYDAAYQFYLDIYGHKPKQVPFDITDQLFVVCEDKICQPTTNPKYEIAAFGMTKVVSEDQIDGIKIFKLTHSDGHI